MSVPPEQIIRELLDLASTADCWMGDADRTERLSELLAVHGPAALDALVADRNTLRAALERIAESYPWEPWDQDETIHDDEANGPEIPSNRRIAREALAALRGETSEHGESN